MSRFRVSSIVAGIIVASVLLLAGSCGTRPANSGAGNAKPMVLTDSEVQLLMEALSLPKDIAPSAGGVMMMWDSLQTKLYSRIQITTDMAEQIAKQMKDSIGQAVITDVEDKDHKLEGPLHFGVDWWNVLPLENEDIVFGVKSVKERENILFVILRPSESGFVDLFAYRKMLTRKLPTGLVSLMRKGRLLSLGWSPIPSNLQTYEIRWGRFQSGAEAVAP